MKQQATVANVITGFLGVGKTTTIQALLQQRPKGERWAVLVNEFGEIGLDGALLNAGAEDELVIREVPGGCICCASGLPFQVALGRLLGKVKPDRLLIEPTGLGHAADIVQLVAGYAAAGHLTLGATLTLVDARKISDTRYREHPVFCQQLQVADLVIAAKSDQASKQDQAALENFLVELGVTAPLIAASFGVIEPALLDLPSGFILKSEQQLLPLVLDTGEDALPGFGSEGYLRSARAADGYSSLGWVFSPFWVFDHNALLILFTGLNVERLKAVAITSEGIISANLADGVLSLQSLDECDFTRIELIYTEAIAPDAEAIEAALLAAGTKIPQSVDAGSPDE